MAFTSAYLAGPRIFFFLLTTSLVVVSCSCAAWAVAYAYDLKDLVSTQLRGGNLDVHDALATGGAFVGVAALIGLMCFAMLATMIFRRREPETLRSVRIKEAVFATFLVLLLATLIAATVIFATRSGVITAPGTPQFTIDTIVRLSGLSLAYSDQKQIKVYIIVGWCAFASTAVNLVLVSLEARHVLKHGPDGGLLGGAAPHQSSSPAPEVATEKKPEQQV